MHLLVSWLILAAAVGVAALILPGFKVRGLGGVLVVAAVFGVLNWLLGWLLFAVIGVGTLGLGFVLAFLSRWLVDALLLELTDFFTDRLKIRSFAWALAAALVMSLVGTAGEALLLHGRRPHAGSPEIFHL